MELLARYKVLLNIAVNNESDDTASAKIDDVLAKLRVQLHGEWERACLWQLWLQSFSLGNTPNFMCIMAFCSGY